MSSVADHAVDAGRRPPSRTPRRARRRRGAAYVEGVILVFFLIIIFAGVQYLGRYVVARQHALEIARRCAWLFSANACTVDERNQNAGIPSVPAYCQAVLRPPQSDADSEVLAQVNQKRDDALDAAGEGAPATGTPEGNLNAGVNEKMDGLVEMAFGQYVTAVASQDVDRTRIVVNAQPSVSAWYYMPCNLKHEDPLDTAIDLFSRILPSGGL